MNSKVVAIAGASSGIGAVSTLLQAARGAFAIGEPAEVDVNEIGARPTVQA